MKGITILLIVIVLLLAIGTITVHQMRTNQVLQPNISAEQNEENTVGRVPDSIDWTDYNNPPR